MNPTTRNYRYTCQHSLLFYTALCDLAFPVFFQIRRYVLHEVILVEDAVKLIDPSECPVSLMMASHSCSNFTSDTCYIFQTYTINGYQAVFINQREHNGRSASKQRQESSCLTCSRVLEGTVKFCSLCCKVSLKFFFLKLFTVYLVVYGSFLGGALHKQWFTFRDYP